jgi:transposase
VAKKAKRYTREFKARAIRLCEESGKPIAEVARDLDVPYQTLYQWMLQAGKAGGAAASASAPAAAETPAEEVRRLRRELDEVKMERDFLKKAAAFFARSNK